MKKLVMAGLLFCLCGCGRDDVDEYRNGTDARNSIRIQRGAPEEVSTYSSGSYWSETWWYWCNGISYSFKKVDRVEEREEGELWNKRTRRIHYNDVAVDSTFTFSPICS